MASPILHACLSDPGRTHAANEDRWLADPVQGLYVVADGMADERPAQLAIDRLPELLVPRLAGIDDAGDPRAEEAIRAILAEVSEEARDLDTTGSTVVLALVRGRRALLAHLGDSRIYLSREDRLRQLTRDHSLLQEMVDRGELTPDEAAAAKYNGGPTRFLGMWGEPDADVSVLDLQPGDRLLLCSDGLTAMLSDEELGRVLAREAAPAEACRRLIDAANAAGGADNITALVLAVPASA
jgi:PPM family protein phosphatase